MTQGLRAQESTLADLLCNGTEMAMPPYQRSYSWEISEAQALISDLHDASDSGDNHFIGAIVLVREESGRFLIVDGQQRLTTLTILLSVLRDTETDPARKKELHALIADEYGGTRDQLSDLVLALAAKRTVKQLAAVVT